MTSFIGYINYVVIKISIYFNAHMRVVENIIIHVKTGHKVSLP
jgi:hypothetical protein